MASDTVSKRNEEPDLALSWSGRWTLAHRILAVNILTLLLLAASVLYLDAFRNQLSEEREARAAYTWLLGRGMTFRFGQDGATELVEGQVEGSIHMGLGYALTEDFPSDEDCRPTVTTLRGLGIIRAKDMPPVDVILVEEPQPDAPYGIKGVGEIGLVPTAGAVAAALHAFDGEWRSSLPMRRG